jgi:protein SCO1/2
MHRSRSRWLLASVALAALAAAAWVNWAAREVPTPSASAFTLLQDPPSLGAVALQDHLGQPFTLERLRGSWSLLFFGYTSCPDICPTTLVELARLRRSIAASGGGTQGVQFVFVSVDPDRDSTEVLARYVQHFDPSLLGVSGSPEQLTQFAAQLGATFAIERQAGNPNYPVYHTSAVFLVDPLARFRAILRPPFAADAVAAEFAALRRDAGARSGTGGRTRGGAS